MHTHTVQIADEFSENILGIDFLQKFWLRVDPKTEEFTFQTAPSKALFATKNFTIPPFTTVLAQARTFQDIDPQLHYIADIGAPKQPWISGLSTLVSFDQRKQCTMPIQNCAPHEINVSTGDILGILSTEKDRREHEPGKKSKTDATLELQNHIAVNILTYWSSIKQQSAWTNTT